MDESKTLNKQELIQKVIHMKNGDVLQLWSLDENNQYIFGTMITKTIWFDNHIVIIGGADDYTFVATLNEDWEGIPFTVKKLINKFCKWMDIKSERFKIDSIDKMNIKVTGSDNFSHNDNFEYINTKWL